MSDLDTTTPSPASPLASPDALAAPEVQEGLAPADAKDGAPKASEKPDPLAAAKANIAKIKARQSRERSMRTESERHRSEARTAAQEATRLREENSKLAQLRQRLASGDPAAFEELGDGAADAVIERVRERNAPDYEIKQLKAQFEEERQERLALQDRIKAEKAAEQDKVAIAKFWEEANDAEKYPMLQALPEDYVLQRADKILADAYARTGHWYTMADACSFIEQESVKRAAAKTGAKTTPKTSPQGAGAEDPNSPPKPRVELPFKLPPNFDTMSNDEANRWMALALTAVSSRTKGK